MPSKGRYQCHVHRCADFRSFNSNFWRFLACFGCFAVGVLIFNELYPLYLLAHGKDVVLVGKVSLALNIGTVIGTIPAAFMLQRLGIRKTLLLSFFGTGLASAVRAFHANGFALFGGAFAAGFFFAVLTVAAVVAISQLTTPGNRARGFSLFFGTSIGSGVLGDAMGGELPGWITAGLGTEIGIDPMLTAILLACIINLLSVIIASKLHFEGSASLEKVIIPRSPKILRLMLTVGIWNFAFGLFTPFFVVFFSVQLGASVRSIGLDLTGGQIVAAAATLMAPMMINRLGTLPAIRTMMFLTGVGAFILCSHPRFAGIAAGYMIYTAFQAMTQPAIYTLLMNQTSKAEQAGASMLNSLVVFSSAALSGYLGGQAIHRVGYERILLNCGISCIIAGIVFSVLNRSKDTLTSAPPKIPASE